MPLALPVTEPNIPFIGVVTHAGPSSRFKPGDEVFGFASGCLAESIVAADAEIAAKPKTLTFEEAAALPTAYLTSLQVWGCNGQ